jgi:hypothetical protein
MNERRAFLKSLVAAATKGSDPLTQGGSDPLTPAEGQGGSDPLTPAEAQGGSDPLTSAEAADPWLER